MLKKKGIPDDFKYLAVAESELANVISPSRATGFWQIMSFTGREYGLEINSQVDERYDPVRSGLVACAYLKNAFEKFDSWTVAAASYNMGMGGINRQLQKQKTTSYYDLALNTETSRYIYRILAFKLILENPERYGFDIPKEERYQMPKMRKQVVKSSIPDLVDYAYSNGVSYKTLRHYNPWLRGYALNVPSGRSYEIQLPEKAPPAHGKRLLTVKNDSAKVDSVAVKEED